MKIHVQPLPNVVDEDRISELTDDKCFNQDRIIDLPNSDELPRKVTLTWQNVSVKAPTGGLCLTSKSSNGATDKKILNGVNGCVKSGETLALMGAR